MTFDAEKELQFSYFSRLYSTISAWKTVEYFKLGVTCCGL